MPPDIASPVESIEALRSRVALSTTFAWAVVSGLSGLAGREHGEAMLNQLWRPFEDRFGVSRSIDDCWDREDPGMPPA